jgi:hypothetical protein
MPYSMQRLGYNIFPFLKKHAEPKKNLINQTFSIVNIGNESFVASTTFLVLYMVLLVNGSQRADKVF